jgi:chitobiase/beta-hexosaminidase-like protein
MLVSTHGRAPGRRRRWRAVLTTAGGVAVAAIFAAPAGAANPPAPPHSIISFPQRDFVSAEGYEEGVPVIVEVLRNGSIIGTSTEVTPLADGLVEVNHPGGGCWVGSTPDIRPGDEVRTTQLDIAGRQDATTTANVNAEPAVIEGSDVVVRGTAFELDGTTPLPLAEIEQRIIAGNPGFENGRRRLQATSEGGPNDDGLLQADALAGPGHWIARYQGLSSDDRERAESSETRILWLGADPLAGNELTIFEVGEGVVNGPSAPCTAPSAETSLGGTTPQVKFINAASAHQDMVVSGLANTDITEVNVSVGGTPMPGVAPTGAIPNRTWSVTVPASVLENAPDGNVRVTASFVSSTNTAPPADSRTLVKDTVVPAAPTATPGAGSYVGPQSVSLASADQSARIHYTLDGSTPTAASRVFDAPLSVTASQTVRAVAVDPAGNVSAASTLPFTILGSAPGGGGSLPTVITQVVPGVGGASAGGVAGTGARALRVNGLTLARRISISRAKARGLRVAMVLPSGTRVVRLAVFRARDGQPSGRALTRVLRLRNASGRYVVTLRGRALLKALKPGRYVVQVTPGRDLDDRGRASLAAFTITR